MESTRVTFPARRSRPHVDTPPPQMPPAHPHPLGVEPLVTEPGEAVNTKPHPLNTLKPLSTAIWFFIFYFAIITHFNIKHW